MGGASIRGGTCNRQNTVFRYDVTDSIYHWSIPLSREFQINVKITLVDRSWSSLNSSNTEQSWLYSLESRAIMAINYVIDIKQNFKHIFSLQDGGGNLQKYIGTNKCLGSI